MQVFKMLNNQYNTNSKIFFSRADGITRGHSKKLEVRRSRLAVRANFYSLNILKDWNSLPEEVISSGH